MFSRVLHAVQSRPLTRSIPLLATVTILGALLGMGCRQQEPQEWLRHIGGLAQFGNFLHVSTSGDVYTTGYFAGDVDFGGRTATGRAPGDIFLAKYSGDGELRWIATGSSDQWNGGRGIASGPGKAVWLTGRFQGDATFGDIRVTAEGDNDAFVARLDDDGTFQWVRALGSSGADWGNTVTSDAEGNVYFAGFFSGTLTTPAGVDSSRGDGDIFLCSYGPDGAFRWLLTGGGAGTDVAYGVAAGADGSTYLTGAFSGTIELGGKPLSSQTTYSGFLASVTRDGSVEWVLTDDGTSSIWSGERLAVDRTGSVHVVGPFLGTLSFGDRSLTSKGAEDLMVLTVSQTGYVERLLGFGGEGRDGAGGFGESSGVAVLDNGDLLIGSSFQGMLELGEFTITSAGQEDLFLMRLSPDGVPRNVTSLGGEAFEGFACTGAGPRNAAYVMCNMISPSVAMRDSVVTKRGSFADILLLRADSGLFSRSPRHDADADSLRPEEGK